MFLPLLQHLPLSAPLAWAVAVLQRGLVQLSLAQAGLAGNKAAPPGAAES